MTTKCILFDADGVIINTEMFSVQYEKEYGVSSEELLPFFKKDFLQCLIGKADLKDTLKPWLSKWKWEWTTEEFLKFWFESEHHIDKWMVEIIEKLKERWIKCYLATNQEKYRTEYMKNEMWFGELFDYVYSSNEIWHKKPDQGFYKSILDELENNHNIHPNEIMFFDDSKKNVEEANKLGINWYFYTNLEEFKSIINPIFK